jgi:soluble lytic murein transglycosylase-like protein
VSTGQPAQTATASTQPVGAAAEGSPVNPPYPTPETVTPSQVGSIAAANGVPPSLADAIAYQESGFNNAAVSTADARGVMQILPGTWEWIQHTLVPGASPLAPASALDNIRGGVLLLRSLLNSTGGDPALAAAGYYQGLPSVQRDGVYPSTQQYVNDVMSLAQRFGGG